MGASYALIYLICARNSTAAARVFSFAFGERFHISQEATGGIKDVKLLGLEDSYIGIYERVARRCAKDQAALGIMSEMPRFALEAITFGTLLTAVLVLLMRSDGNITEIVPTLGIFAFSVMRLLPALQQIYFSLASIRGAKSILETLATDYAQATRMPHVSRDQPPLRLERKLELSGLSFAYRTAARPALMKLDLKNRRVQHGGYRRRHWSRKDDAGRPDPRASNAR